MSGSPELFHRGGGCSRVSSDRCAVLVEFSMHIQIVWSSLNYLKATFCQCNYYLTGFSCFKLTLAKNNGEPSHCMNNKCILSVNGRALLEEMMRRLDMQECLQNAYVLLPLCKCACGFLIID